MSSSVRLSQQKWILCHKRDLRANPARLLNQKAPALLTTDPDPANQPSTSTERRPSDPAISDKPVTFPEPCALSNLVDVHAELYNLPLFQFLADLLDYLFSNHRLQLRPVSTLLTFIILSCRGLCVVI